MKIIVPDSIEVITTIGGRTNQAAVLRLVFRHNNCVAAVGGFADGLADLFQNVNRAGVADGVYGVQPQAVEMKLVYPIGRVAGYKFTDGRGVLAVIVDCRAPIGGVARGEVVR